VLAGIRGLSGVEVDGERRRRNPVGVPPERFHCRPDDSRQMKTLVSRFLAAESGAAIAKYGLIAGVISAAIVTAALGIVAKLAVGGIGP
jgi:Flp pilus assembly pilin Flp